MKPSSHTASPRTLFAVFLFLFASLACSATPLAEYVVASGGVLYQDDFSESKDGWGEFSGDVGIAGYSDRAYRFYVKAENVSIWAHPGVDFATVRLEADTYSPNGFQENRMGLVCRMQDDKNFYFFIITSDGYYGIGKARDGQWSLLNGEQMQSSDAILTGQLANHLRADCIGNLLILYANGHLVGSALDTDFARGDVGVLAGSSAAPGADVYFDNFVVVKP